MVNLDILTGGTRFWRLTGQLHRTNGPSVMWDNGYQAWHNYGKLHRTDGPAVTYSSGQVEYWINGKQLSEYEIMFMNESCV